LSLPRLHFAGRFRVDVSTVNNNPANFENPNDPKNPPSPGWNPNGSGSWALEGCRILRAVRGDGSIAETAAEDPVVGTALEQVGTARLVDLDPQQQLVSQIWGMRLRLAASGGGPTFSGAFKLTAFSDLWFERAQVPGGGDRKMSAFYHSLLTGVAWTEPIQSRALTELRQASTAGNLSIKFNVDGFNQSARIGRVVGTIGPALAGEPDHFVAGRHCMPVPDAGVPIWFFPAIIDAARARLVADFGNALPTTGVGGAPVDPSLRLEIGWLDKGGKFTSLGPVPIGPAGWYERTAGICEFPADRPLSAAELGQLQSAPIAVRAQGTGGPALAAREGSDGLHVRVEGFVYRMGANEQASATLRATRFGRPAPGVPIALSFDSTWVPEPDPKDGVTFPATIAADAQGIASLPLRAGAIGRPRDFIDGQVYGVGYSLPQSDPAGGYRNPWNFISLRVFSDFPMPAEPTWFGHVLPIFAQYAGLYPVMRDIVQLDDYHDVVANKDAIRAVFLIAEDDPRYMPVTRDLSPKKRQMILNWLETTGNGGRPNLGAPPVAAAAAAGPPAARAEEPGGKTLAVRRIGGPA
jgi:hypothetical protein